MPVRLGPNFEISAQTATKKSGLGVAREVTIDAFRQQTFASPLATTRECGASTLCPHPRPKTVLALARSLGWLKSAFHRGEK